MSTAPNSTDEPMVEHALHALARGLPVFPICSPLSEGRCLEHGQCSNAGKRPLVRWEAYQSSLPSEQEIRSWWGRWPHANIGMATGALSGVVVLDVDSPEAKKMALQEGGCDETVVVFTGKPGGTHFWFRHPGEQVRNFAARRPGLDFRGDGGYVLMPPSRHVRGANYRWPKGMAGFELAELPGWVRDLLRPKGEADDSERHTPLDVATVLNGVGEGQRDASLWSLACKMRGQGLPIEYARELVALAASRCVPPFDHADAIEKVNRAYREYQPDPRLVLGGATAAPGGTSVAQAAQREPYEWMDLRSLLAYQEGPVEHLIDGLLVKGRAHLMFSLPGAGKSMLALSLGLSVASGKPFSGRGVQQGTVLYVNEDASVPEAAEYATLMADTLRISEEDETPFWINRSRGLRINDEIGSELIKLIVLEKDPTLVILDSSEALIPSEHYNRNEYDPMIQLCNWLIDQGITVLILDHQNKRMSAVTKSEERRNVDPLDLVIGGRAKSAAVAFIIWLTGRLSSGTIRLQWVKARGPEKPTVTLKFDDADGFRISETKPTIRPGAEQKIVQWINHHGLGPFTSDDVIGGTGLQMKTARNALRRLADIEVIEKEDAVGGGHERVIWWRATGVAPAMFRPAMSQEGDSQ
ncbi:MAG: bifunctional DNA primase/polymerase [Chloroflexota bacterium]